MAPGRAEDVRASFLFVGDLNGHHREWSTTNRYGLAAFAFATVSGCDQLVVGSTSVRGGTLDLLITDVHDLARVDAVALIGNLDRSSLSVVISMAQAVPNFCICRKVSLKHQFNWYIVCSAIHYLSWRNIWLCWQSCWGFEQRSGPAGSVAHAIWHRPSCHTREQLQLLSALRAAC